MKKEQTLNELESLFRHVFKYYTLADTLAVNHQFKGIMTELREELPAEDFISKIRNVDKELLARQKAALAEMPQSESIDGILNLLDVITDFIDPVE